MSARRDVLVEKRPRRARARSLKREGWQALAASTGHSHAGSASTRVIDYRESGDCFEPTKTTVDMCFVCTLENGSASLGHVCAADPQGRVYVLTTRPDLRLEADGWHFGHRRARDVYTTLEPETLTAEESDLCERAIARLGQLRDTKDFTCGAIADASADAALD